MWNVTSQVDDNAPTVVGQVSTRENAYEVMAAVTSHVEMRGGWKLTDAVDMAGLVVREYAHKGRTVTIRAHLTSARNSQEN